MVDAFSIIPHSRHNTNYTELELNNGKFPDYCIVLVLWIARIFHGKFLKAAPKWYENDTFLSLYKPYVLIHRVKTNKALLLTTKVIHRLRFV